MTTYLTSTQCFLVERTGRARYSSNAYTGGKCPASKYGIQHHIETFGDWIVDDNAEPDWSKAPELILPGICECGFELTAEMVGTHRGKGREPEWRRVDTGEITTSPWRLGAGALYFVEAMMCKHEPPCEKHLHAETPGGGWDIDSRASNCTMPDDKVHHCWVRHGEPPNITVDKNGVTCEAGAGSIISGDYHGFLRDGAFTPGC